MRSAATRSSATTRGPHHHVLAAEYRIARPRGPAIQRHRTHPLSMPASPEREYCGKASASAWSSRWPAGLARAGSGAQFQHGRGGFASFVYTSLMPLICRPSQRCLLLLPCARPILSLTGCADQRATDRQSKLSRFRPRYAVRPRPQRALRATTTPRR